MKRPAACALLLLAACSAPASDPRILESATGYSRWGRVDETARLVLTDCFAPPVPPPRLSASRDPETHGRKLYYLFAKDTLAYAQA